MSADAVERSFTVRRELWLHARPAGQFVSLASRFDCEIEVGRDIPTITCRADGGLPAKPGREYRVVSLQPPS